MPIDATLLQYWQAQQAARKRARASVPAAWRRDPRPEMGVVAETFVESMVTLRAVPAPEPTRRR
ncbi:MAG: hypothetical protein ACXVRJ_08685 [Gaiellaceae bacterium]